MSRYSVLSKSRMRSLKQYKDLTDEEFETVWEDKVGDIETTKDFEDRIKIKIDEITNDYDISDLKANDKLTLRALAQAFIQLEDLERFVYNKRINGIAESSVLLIEKINNMISNLRKDISNMQNDLKITRKIRKGDKEQTLINYLEDLKLRAKEFYSQKMSYIWCPECKMLLGTIWTLYPEEKSNKIQLVCNRILENGEMCGTKIITTTRELLDRRGVSTEDVPEFFK